MPQLNLTPKQEALIEYLLIRLGFNKEKQLFWDYYGYMLSPEAFDASKYRHLRAKYLAKDDLETPVGYEYDGEVWLPKRYTIIDLLIDEYKLKKTQSYDIRLPIKEYITASDLANFAYCPAGFSIGSSFKLPKLYISRIGTKLHEEHCLLKQFIFDSRNTNIIDIVNAGGSFTLKNYTNDDKKLYNKELIEDIIGSQMLFSGHIGTNNIKEQTYSFYNKQLNFSGQPDYIFKSKNGNIFIVEEKFHLYSEYNKTTFFKTHKVQLASYLYYLNNIAVDYGYLVYWFYSSYNNEICLEKSCVFKLFKSSKVSNYLIDVYNNVTEFKKNKTISFDPSSLKLNKCFNCVYYLYCGHKNGRRTEVRIPYQTGYNNFFPAEYPYILRNDDDEIFN